MCPSLQKVLYKFLITITTVQDLHAITKGFTLCRSSNLSCLLQFGLRMLEGLSRNVSLRRMSLRQLTTSNLSNKHTSDNNHHQPMQYTTLHFHSLAHEGGWSILSLTVLPFH